MTYIHTYKDTKIHTYKDTGDISQHFWVIFIKYNVIKGNYAKNWPHTFKNKNNISI